jgi:hypothetical protein
LTKGGNLSRIPALRRESRDFGKQLFENGIENDDAKACLEYIVRVAVRAGEDKLCLAEPIAGGAEPFESSALLERRNQASKD